MTKILHKNPNNPSALLYSKLDQLEKYRTYEGKFHLKIVYPELGRSNEWKQKSNPVTDTKIEGFEAIKLDFKFDGHRKPWRGLGFCENVKALICDTPSRQYWWMAVGAKNYNYKGIIPGPVWSSVKKVEVHVKIGKILIIISNHCELRVKSLNVLSRVN